MRVHITGSQSHRFDSLIERHTMFSISRQRQLSRYILSKNLISFKRSKKLSAMSNLPVTAFTDPRAFLSIHGIATRPSIGSQVNPKECSLFSIFWSLARLRARKREKVNTHIPISAACRICSIVPPIQAVNAAAAIEVETPTSAIHLSIQLPQSLENGWWVERKRELTLPQQLKSLLLVYTTFQ